MQKFKMDCKYKMMQKERIKEYCWSLCKRYRARMLFKILHKNYGKRELRCDR